MSLQISVIIPVYNCEEYLDHCIESVLNQTLRNFELILIDDGSTDSSPQICDNFAAMDDRIIVIHKENSGVSCARNEGIKAAKGEYLTFIDADDYIDSQMLEKLYQMAKDNSTDMIVSGIVMETWDNEEIKESVEFKIKNSILYSPKELLKECGNSFPLICISGPCCKLYKLETIKKENILFDINLSRGEDTCFNLDVISKIKNIFFTEDVFYHYRRWNPNSLFTKFRKDVYEILCIVNEKQLKIMIDLGCDKVAIEKFKCDYVKSLLGEIHEHFKFYEFNTKQERLELIEKIVNNQRVKECKVKYANGIKNKILVILLKMKKTKMVLKIFERYYKSTKLKDK